MSPRIRISLFAALASLLGSLSLLPIYDNYGWLPRVILMIAVVTTTSVVVQRARALAAAAPLLMVAAWLCLLTLLYAHTVAPLGFVPGPAALRQLHETMSNGFDDTTQLAAPVPVTRGLSLLTTGGIGLVAIVVETLTSGLRRPAVAGLPLLAIFTVPAAILRDGVGWQPFVFASAGYLALLLAEGRDRITRWGRPVRATRHAPDPRRSAATPATARAPAGSAAAYRPPRPGVATNQLTQLGRRVGATAIGVAIVVPVVIPGLHAGWFGTHHTSGAGGLSTDDSGGASINPIVSLRRDLRQSTPVALFSYTTTGVPDYLRMLTLDKFNGVEWRPAATSSDEDVDASDELPPPANVIIAPEKTVTTDIDISGLKEPYLPTPMVPTKLDAHGDWRYNPVTSVLYSTHSSTVHLEYKVTSAVYKPSPDMLNAVAIDPADPTVSKYLAVPNNLPAGIKAQADSVIVAAHATTAYQKAVALQNWFQSNFFYDVSISGSDNNALLSFLRDRRGYCEQFAATMALMARLEGIPSRVNIGFTPGTQIAGSKSYLVTTADAHAWPELYFPGAGWLRFEPTPRADGQTTRPAYANPTAAPASSGPGAAGATTIPGGQLPQEPHAVPNLQPSGGTGGGFSFSTSQLPVGWIAVLFVLLLAALAAPTVRWRTRRRRWAEAATDVERAHAAWHELGDDMRDLGLEWHGNHDSPRRAAAALIATRRLGYDPKAAEALARLARAEELARYAGPQPGRLAGLDPRSDQVLVRRSLMESVPRSRRLRARLAPPSTGQVFAAAAAAVSEWARGLLRRIADAASERLPARQASR